MTTITLNKRRLGTYVNDHLAGSTAIIELAKRTAGSNAGSPYGDFLARLVADIDQDRHTLMDIMDRLDIDKNQLKVSLGWAAEKVGRLKLNDQLIGYSPLSRLIEFEGLMLGVTGTWALWSTLRDAVGDEPALAGVDFDALIARADDQRRQLEQHRREAAHGALTDA